MLPSDPACVAVPVQVPPSTFILWVSPPPRYEMKWHKPELPPEWIRIYDRVAQVRAFGCDGPCWLAGMCH